MTVAFDVPPVEAVGGWCAHAAIQALPWAVFLTVAFYLCLALSTWTAVGLVWLGAVPGRK